MPFVLRRLLTVAPTVLVVATVTFIALQVIPGDIAQIMLGTDQASSMLRYSLTVLDTNKPVRVRLAHFAQFRDGKLSRMRILIDTYDLVEQAFGLPLRRPQLAASA